MVSTADETRFYATGRIAERCCAKQRVRSATGRLQTGSSRYLMPDFVEPFHRHKMRRLEHLRKKRYAQIFDLPAKILQPHIYTTRLAQLIAALLIELREFRDACRVFFVALRTARKLVEPLPASAVPSNKARPAARSPVYKPEITKFLHTAVT